MSLDIPEPQVLVSTGDGTWDHWVLLKRQQDAVWLALDPGSTVEALDLRVLRIIALARNQDFPVDEDEEVRTFDDAPSERDLRDAHARANRTAGLLGLPAGGAAGSAGGFAPRRPSSWRVCHPGCEFYGDEVPDDVVGNSTTGVDKGTMGLALLEGYWWPVERVRNDEVDSWLAGLRGGPRRDPRLAGDVRDAGGKRFVNLSDYMGLLRPIDRAKDKDWPHRGPSAAAEVLSGVRGCGRELVTYDEFWAQTSGVQSGSNLRLLHKTIFHALALLQSYDQVDVPALAGAEYLARRAIQVQRAVRANPKCPTFQGLEKMCDHTLDEATGLATQDFTKHFADISEADAKIMKQQRLLRTEMNSRPGGAPPKADSDDDGEQPAQKRKNRPKAKAKAARPPG